MALPIDYTLIVKQDKFYLTNNEVGSDLNYTIKNIAECTVDTIEATGVITPLETLELPITTDGTHFIELVRVTDLITEEVYIQYYLNLQLSMIEDIFTVLCPCDCGCKACVDLSCDKCEALLTARNKIDVFKYLTAPYYDAAFSTVHRGTSCLIEPQLYCDVAIEGVTGVTEYNETLTKELIAIDYLAMYFWDIKIAESAATPEQVDLDYINDKYQSESILCCINSLGIDIKEIQQLIEDMASGTINSAVYIALPPTNVGFLEVDLDNREAGYEFTEVDFTENVVGGYPPAGPNPTASTNLFHSIRIDTILATGDPDIGILMYDGVPITVVPQIITLVEINAGKLSYDSPNVDVSDTDTFTYSVSNVGAPSIFISSPS